MPKLSNLLRASLAPILLGAAALATSGGPIMAATFCVSHSIPGCSTTIAAAIAAASAGDIIDVNTGTYGEDVVIGKSISLVGVDPGSTVINARGLANGIYVDGIDNPGLNHVLVTGFTVRNANFEGILVTNASNVTIQNNKVLHNDLSLDFASETCPGQPAFETSEGDDCGEGIHLIGADHSTIADNSVTGNSGGILLTDETLENHDNLISGNAVLNNAFDCGITLASHPPASGGGSPLGVVHNTIINNTSIGNGTLGQGAGVGMFSFLSGGTVTQNAVLYNQLSDNGLPGVAFHAHSPGENLNDNVIVGNVIERNGGDSDASTPGPSGIVIFGVSAITGTVIAQNTIKRETVDIFINTPATVDAHLNNLLAEGGTIGVDNAGSGAVNATENFWDCVKGPGHSGCSSAAGTVTTAPFLSFNAP